jgi:subtilase family serine protease
MFRPREKLKAALAIAACLVIAAPLVPRDAPVPLVRLAPASMRPFRQALGAPPDTAACRIRFGVACYQPAQLRKAYDLDPLLTAGLDGTGRTIVIVDAFGSPTINEDLRTFDQAFGLPDPPSLQVVQPAGPVPPYPQDPAGVSDRMGWAGETTLDVEWSHVVAPGASILLVETPTPETEGIQGFPEIVQAENYVVDHDLGDVISQSFAATEETFPDPATIRGLRTAFVNARRHQITVLASSGDQGATSPRLDGCCYPFRVVGWPSSDPLVTSVGGTQLHLDAAGNRTAPDNVWNDGGGATGGGPSHVFERPSFQDGVASVVGDARGTPDLSMSAALDGAVDVFSSFCDSSAVDPSTGKPLRCPAWHLSAGTSEASPELAGIIAIADQAAGRRLGWLNPDLYRLAEHGGHSGIVDVQQGSNTFQFFCTGSCGTPTATATVVPGFQATKGYDMASGLGTIDAARFVKAIAGLGAG